MMGGGGAGGDGVVAASLDVGVDAQGGAGAALKTSGFGGESVEFGFGFDVEKQNTGAESFADFFFCFSDAGKNDAVAGDADMAQAMEFAAGDDVETASCAS